MPTIEIISNGADKKSLNPHTVYFLTDSQFGPDDPSRIDIKYNDFKKCIITDGLRWNTLYRILN